MNESNAGDRKSQFPPMSTDQLTRSIEAIYEALYEVRNLTLEIADTKDARVMYLDQAVQKLSSIIYCEPFSAQSNEGTK
jgi:hypothetical protein